MTQILGVQALRDIIPCRYPMLLLDQVFIESETKAFAWKTISMDELCFHGHFPGHPILPGVLQVEAASQLAEVMLWKKLDPERKGDFYLKELRKVKFRRPNNPGDRMLIELDVTLVSSDEASFTATVSNSGGVACNIQGKVSVRAKETRNEFNREFNEFDKGRNCVMDVNHVMEIIPHRYPFLFVDYVAKIDGGHVTGVKNATDGEMIFREYKDGYTVLSSALQPEIAAQAGAIYMLSHDETKGKIAYFMGIDESEFYFPIFPGDQLRLEVEIPNTKSRFGRGEGEIIVNGKTASHTTMLFAIVDP